MGIFSKIKDAIFGKKAKAQTTDGAAAGTSPDFSASSTAPAAAPAAAAPIDVSISEVDVMANLAAMGEGKNLNYKTSIVDLMKLLDIDPSLQNRKELAQELGYTGELNGSAEMNIWLHKAVMKELAKNGGHVPAELLD